MIFILVCLLLQLPQSTWAEVWPNQNQWNMYWENRYSDWVRSNWSVDFFSRESLPDGSPNPYYGFRKDCADTVYSMRTIFSYEQKLPFAMNDPTGSGRVISNSMTRFDRTLDPRARARIFLQYLDTVVSTRSMPQDTYPISVNRQSVRAGGVMMATALNHHSWTVKEILPHRSTLAYL